MTDRKEVRLTLKDLEEKIKQKTSPEEFNPHSPKWWWELFNIYNLAVTLTKKNSPNGLWARRQMVLSAKNSKGKKFAKRELRALKRKNNVTNKLFDELFIELRN